MGRLGCNVPSASSSVSPKDVYEKWGHRRDGLQKELGQGGGGQHCTLQGRLKCGDAAW